MGLSILAVDDEADFVATLAKRFAFRHIPVTAAASGREALDLLERQDCDVVVLDVRMPDMDGLTALAEIKKRHPLVEVILLTGHASREARAQGMALGAFAYLLKPVDFKELLEKVEQARQCKARKKARADEED